ncbi:MAG: HAD family hydrolase [Planifilum fimeticola]
MNCGEKTAVFDMDGTLFQSEKVALPAFRRAFRRLKEESLYRGDPPSDEEIQSVFGMTQEEIWARLLPEADEKTRKIADRWTLEEELAGLRRGEGSLYPGVAETLHRLKEEGWRLFIASNGLRPYLDGVLETFRLASLFSGVYGAGDYETETKDELVRLLMEEHGVSGGFMVGDRKSDVEAGKANGLKVIGCRYPGYTRFGRADELKDADVVVDRFPDILSVLMKACGDPS